MHLSHLVLTVVLTLIRFCYADEFRPRVTKVKDVTSGYNVQCFDDSTTMIKSSSPRISISTDNGKTWKKLKNLNADYASVDPFHSRNRAIALSLQEARAYITEDMGENWNLLNVGVKPEKGDLSGLQVRTHPTSEDYLIAQYTVFKPFDSLSDSDDEDEDHGYDRFQMQRKRSALISKDRGKNFQKVESLENANIECSFGVTSPKSSLVDDDKTIFCLERVVDRGAKHGQSVDVRSKFSYTKDFGKSFQELNQFKDMMISSMKVLDSYVMVFTQEDRFNERSNKQIWVSSDGISFNKAYLPTQLRFIDESKLFEDSMGKIILPVGAGKESQPSSQIYVSDSRGLKFSVVPWTANNPEGYYSISESSYFPGTMLAEFQGMTRSSFRKGMTSKSKISFDGGFSWENLKVVDPEKKADYPCDIDDVENCSLHTNSFGFAREHNAAPGIMAKFGAVGDGTKSELEDAALFLSRDGGKTWKKSSQFDGPALFAFGDMGNVIVACPFDPDQDGGPQSKFYYSLDQGETWTEYQLDTSMMPGELISTTTDGSGVNFVLRGFGSNKNSHLMYAIDFSEAFGGKKCEDQDLETFYIADGECVNGVKRKYSRRKLSSACLIREPFVDLEWEEEVCEECTTKDYEYSFEFSRGSSGQCELDYQLLNPSDSPEGKPMQLMQGSGGRFPKLFQ